MNPRTPCIGICEHHFWSDLCKGCGRTHEEIMDWSMMGEEKKVEVLEKIKDRKFKYKKPIKKETD